MGFSSLRRILEHAGSVGFTGGSLQVQRYLQPLRAPRRWEASLPGVQAIRQRRTYAASAVYALTFVAFYFCFARRDV